MATISTCLPPIFGVGADFKKSHLVDMAQHIWGGKIWRYSKILNGYVLELSEEQVPTWEELRETTAYFFNNADWAAVADRLTLDSITFSNGTIRAVSESCYKNMIKGRVAMANKEEMDMNFQLI